MKLRDKMVAPLISVALNITETLMAAIDSLWCCICLLREVLENSQPLLMLYRLRASTPHMSWIIRELEGICGTSYIMIVNIDENGKNLLNSKSIKVGD
ncbi:hypothetical protein NTG1052_140112 [Candidatus Nitrotoga sp. 1052]|nr:hypothetical protein NTG1052_140112 [Candidatus Nitrotoga sp. 1052]